MTVHTDTVKVAVEAINRLGFEVQEHLSYSSDLAPSD
jgi:hypothetical protein